MGTTSERNLGVKISYRPIEAAIRWCSLQQHESRILRVLGTRSLLFEDDFPRWPRLRLNTERIFDALAHGELLRDNTKGRAEPSCVDEDDPGLRVRHVDLRQWMQRFYPYERPTFLFDKVERMQHPAIGAAELQALLNEVQILGLRLNQESRAHRTLREAHEALQREALANTAQVPGPRAETTYLNIIGGLQSLLLGKSPAGTPYSSFRTTEAVISTLIAHHGGRSGITERTLWAKLAQAKRRLEEPEE